MRISAMISDYRLGRRLSRLRTKTAESDLTNLKVTVKTDVKLVGVYKTTYKDTRHFAVIESPTGNRIKRPIDEKRYAAMEKKDRVDVVLEEVHDFADYDLAYAKFRGGRIDGRH